MFEIRRATEVDIDKLLYLESVSFEKPWSRGQLHSLLEDYDEAGVAQEFALLLEEAGIACAYIAWQTVLDEATLLSLAVHPDYRRRGLASRLLRASENYLQTHGVRRLFLEVSERNALAQNFYMKEGFSKDGERLNYYGLGEAAWLMSRDLLYFDDAQG